MTIAGLQKMTLLDFPGKVACTVFLAGCNLRCPFCHNRELVLPEERGSLAPLTREELLDFLRRRQGMLDGVCVTGGEPLLSNEVFGLLREIKALGYAVKLDTNGGFPGRLRRAVVWASAGLIGMYDGYYGPGTGTFMILAFTLVLGMDLLTASGCAKAANLASNVASAVVWIAGGKVYWQLAVPAVVCCVAGNWCGARYAIRGGSTKVRRMIFVVLGLLFLKMGWELLT